MDVSNHYWNQVLRAPVIFRVLRENRRTAPPQLVYIDATRPARIVLSVLRLLRSPIRLRKLKPRWNPSGPRGLNLSSVRNENGEVITFDLYHQVLEIRRKIAADLMNSCPVNSLYREKKDREMLDVYIGMKVAEAVTPAVYMANYAALNRDEEECEKNNHTLVIPASPWNRVLVSFLEEKKLVDRIWIDKKNRSVEYSLSRLLKHITAAILKGGLWGVSKSTADTRQKAGEPARVIVNYRMGLLESQRNDMAFFHAGDIEPGRLVVYCKSPRYLPSGEELQWIKENGVLCFAAPGIRPGNDIIHPWKSSLYYKKNIRAFYRKYIKTAIRAFGRGKQDRWILEQLWILADETASWRDFFRSHNVKVLVNSIPSDTNFVPNIAMTQSGGLVAELERSIRFDYCTYIHNSPNHFYFATGPYSLTQVPEPWYSRMIVQTGGINIHRNDIAIDGFEQLKAKSPIVVGVFDELSNDWFFGDSIRQMYRLLIDLLKQDHRFSLLIKTKKPQVLESIEDVNREMKQLTEAGRCLFPSWRVTPAAAASKADFVVTVPSTAAFESIMTGTPTAVFNPMRTGSTVFYKNNGLNRRIFEESEPMIEALKRFADGDHSIGDCTDIFSFIDPYGDGNGAARMGHFIHRCLKEFDGTGSAESDSGSVMNTVAQWYRKEWGTDKITVAAELSPSDYIITSDN